MEYSILLLTVASMLCTRCCYADEFELCYLNLGDNNSVLCIKSPSTHPCCGPMTEISVVVYREVGCDSPSVCRAQNSCCNRTNPINITFDYKNELETVFRRNCFNSVEEDNVATEMPKNNGLDLVVVSYMCPVKTTKQMPIQPSPTTYNSTTVQTTAKHLPAQSSTTVHATITTSPSTQSTSEGTSSNVAVAVPVSVTIVVVAAVAVVTLFYLRRRRTRKNATENPQKTRSNNAYTGSVSKSAGLYLNTITSTKADDKATTYTEFADNSVHFNYSFRENNEYRSNKPKERTSNNEPLANSSTTDNDPTGEDEYDHLGTQDTPSSRKNNYEHITHISKDNCHPSLYDKTEFNQGNTNSFDDEDNYNHARQNGAAGRTETEDRDGGYSHVGGTVDGPRADDQYTTMESVMDTQDGSCATNNYFVLEKQY